MSESRPRRAAAWEPEELRELEAIGIPPSELGASSTCPDPGLILAAREGVLDEEVSRRVQAHVATCASCQNTAHSLGDVLDEEPAAEVRDRIAKRVLVGRPEPSRQRWIWWLPATGLVFATSMAWLMVMRAPALPIVAAPGPTARVTAVARPSVFQADRPAIASGETELTLRGQSTEPSLQDRLDTAIQRADRGDLDSAIAALELLARRNSQSADAQLALGATLVRAGRFLEALPLLERARTLAASHGIDEVDWFRAIALVRSGSRDEARTLVSSICEHEGSRAAVACAGLAELSPVVRAP